MSLTFWQSHDLHTHHLKAALARTTGTIIPDLPLPDDFTYEQCIVYFDAIATTDWTLQACEDYVRSRNVAGLTSLFHRIIRGH